MHNNTKPCKNDPFLWNNFMDYKALKDELIKTKLLNQNQQWLLFNPAHEIKMDRSIEPHTGL